MRKESLSGTNLVQSPGVHRSRGVQREDVWEAADAVLQQGERPTIERVRHHLGSGSPNTVGPHLEQWFKQLGARIGAPDAFTTPHGVPDPVLQVAQRLWEIALVETRSDFDERLQAGLRASVDNVEAEKQRAELAVSAAGEATERASRLESALNEMGPLLSQAREDLAAQQGRLDEVRVSWASANERLKQEREEVMRGVTEIKQQLLSAVGRADAADRRVALELDRERTARARAERQAEMLQKSLEASQTSALAASEQMRQTQQASSDREDALKIHLATNAVALSEERQRVDDLRAVCAAKASEASAAHAQAEGLQGALNRLSKLVEEGMERKVKPERQRVTRALVPRKRI